MIIVILVKCKQLTNGFYCCNSINLNIQIQTYNDDKNDDKNNLEREFEKLNIEGSLVNLNQRYLG